MVIVLLYAGCSYTAPALGMQQQTRSFYSKFRHGNDVGHSLPPAAPAVHSLLAECNFDMQLRRRKQAGPGEHWTARRRRSSVRQNRQQCPAGSGRPGVVTKPLSLSHQTGSARQTRPHRRSDDLPRSAWIQSVNPGRKEMYVQPTNLLYTIHRDVHTETERHVQTAGKVTQRVVEKCFLVKWEKRREIKCTLQSSPSNETRTCLRPQQKTRTKDCWWEKTAAYPEI